MLFIAEQYIAGQKEDGEENSLHSAQLKVLLRRRRQSSVVVALLILNCESQSEKG